MKRRWNQNMKRILSFIMVFTMVLALVPATAFAADETTVYLKPNANWLIDGARFAAYFFGNGETWVDMTDTDGDGYYECEAPEGYPSVIFCRMNPDATANNWNNKWNQTANLTVPTDGTNCYTVAEGTWDSGGGTWSTYTPESESDDEDETVLDYYLVGYINGADYSGDDYKFVDGKLTASFTTDTYVMVKDSTGVEYMTDGWLGEVQEATLSDKKTLAAPDKMHVVGGAEVTFTLAENEDGSLTLSYEQTVEYTYTLHFQNNDSWGTVYTYAWITDPVLGDWPGTAATANANNAGWYDASVICSESLISFIFNGNGGQTGDLSVSVPEGQTSVEAWITGTTQDDVTTTAPEGWATAPKDYYLIGYIDGTDYDGKDYKFENGKLSACFTAESYVMVKDSNDTKYMTDGWQDFNKTEVTLYEETTVSGDKWWIPANTEIMFTLTENSDGSLTVSYVPKLTYTIHFSNSESWKTVNAYAWTDAGNLLGDWPGTAMTANANNEGWVDATVETFETSINFIINNGTGGQTADLSTSDLEVWVTLGEKSDENYPATVSNTAPEGWGVPGPAEGGFVTVADLVQIKIGDTTYTMEAYTNGIHEVTVPVTAGDVTAALLINGVEKATLDTTVAEDGNLTYRLQDGELTVVTLDTLVVSGNHSALGASEKEWDTAEPKMEYMGGGWYGYTFAFGALASDVTYEYKITYNNSWDGAIDDGNGNNRKVTVPAGTTQLTILVDNNTRTVYESFTEATVQLIGTVRQNDSTNWDASAAGWEFDQITDSLYRYQATFPAGSYEYKAIVNGAWFPDGMNNNHSFKLTETAQVIFLYDAENKILMDSVSNTKDVAELLGMNVPVPAFKVITEDNGTVTFVAAAEAGQGVVLYYANKADVEGSVENAFTKVDLPGVTDGTTQITLDLGEDALDIVYYYEIAAVETLDTSAETVTIGETKYSHYTRDKITGRDVYVPGSFPDASWDAASHKMTYLGNGLYEYVFENLPAANYEYKIAIGGGWDENYGAGAVPGGDNIPLAVPETQDVTIWYNDYTHNTVNSIEYVFAEVELTGTGIPEDTFLTDEGLTGIYSVTVSLEAQEAAYDDLKLIYQGEDGKPEEYFFAAFTLAEGKDVTFYFDPATGIYYHNGSDVKVAGEYVYYDSKDLNYKNPYGAVPTNTDVTFNITTGDDATQVTLVVKGYKSFPMTYVEPKAREAGTMNWTVTATFTNIGEYDYYFAISNGSDVKVYGDDDGYYGTGKISDLNNVMPYDLVVYKNGFETPDWMKNAVIYQIFPDRFFDGNSNNNEAQIHARGAVNYEFVTDWYALPENPEQEAMLSESDYKATGAYYGDGEWSNEIYGGDLQGIIQKIDYLKALGVNVIYLNPVFSSISNHRYDACDYTEIDPILGTLGDFEALVAVAEANDMHIILDGVYNHVSDDSIYFDRYYRFLGTSEKIGAYPYWAYVYDYMAENSAEQDDAELAAKKYFTEEYGITDYAYVEWFQVNNSFMEGVTDSVGLRAGKGVYSYQGWWGYDSMPVIYSTNGSEYQTGTWAEEIIYNEDGTSVTQYWITKGSNGWRLDVANEVSDETWRNFRASVKSLDSDAVIIGEIWDDATKYLKGDMYDSVMNYMFRNAVTSFAMGTNAETTAKELEKIRERYPEEAFYAMMNLVASHDTSRVLSYLDGIGDDRAQKDIDSAFPTYEGTSDLAKNRQYLVAFLQFTYPGAPTIYYGDEIGMVGADDPDDRRAFTWGKGNQDIVEWYAKMAAIREAYPALREGDIQMLDLENDNLLAYVRSDETNKLIVIANNSQSAVTVANLPAEADVSGYVDLVSGEAFAGTVPALRGVILVPADQAKEVTVNYAGLKDAYDPSAVVGNRTVGEMNYGSYAVTVELGDEAAVTVKDALVNTFEKVTLDGQDVDAGNYDVTTTDGGTIITFSADYLETLGEGEYTFTIHFNGGTATVKVTVEKAEEPTTAPTEPEETEKPTEKPTEPEETEKPTEKPTEPEETEKPTEKPTEAETTKPTTKPSTGSNADTGDNSMVLIWTMLLVLSAAGIAVAAILVIRNKKRA